MTLSSKWDFISIAYCNWQCSCQILLSSYQFGGKIWSPGIITVIKPVLAFYSIALKLYCGWKACLLSLTHNAYEFFIFNSTTNFTPKVVHCGKFYLYVSSYHVGNTLVLLLEGNDWTFQLFNLFKSGLHT